MQYCYHVISVKVDKQAAREKMERNLREQQVLTFANFDFG